MGLSRDSRHWQPFPHLLQKHFPDSFVITPDLPGTGSLFRGKSPTSIYGMLAFYRDSLNRQDIPPPYYVIGLSMGGMVALDWVQRFPDEIQATVLINTSARPFCPFYRRLRYENYWTQLREIVWRRTVPQREAVIFDLVCRLYPDKKGLVARWAQYQYDKPISNINATRQLFAAAKYRSVSEAPQRPTLVLCSEQDRLVHPSCSQQLAESLRLEIRVHREAGHELPIDDASWVVEQIIDWLPSQRT